MKTNIKRKPVILAGAIVLALVMVLAATFAWFTANDSVKNKLATKDALANVSIQETFVEPDDWKPGQTITKEVAVADTGAAPALVRVSFKELLTVNQPATGETDVFDTTMETAKKRPQLFDNTPFTGTDWFEVTTTANAAKGGIKLAADYSPVKVYAKYVPAAAGAGSIGSYSFAIWAPITGTDYDGKLQAVSYDREWNNTDKILTLDNIKYLTYQGELSATADWTSDKPAAADINKSVAEGKINEMTAVAGNYPNNIQLNYDNITETPTAGKWYYNENDGYFYYVGLAEPGTVTPNMLKSLLLKNTADGDYYANMNFELTVNMNAVQHTKDAIASEWTGVADDAELKSALELLCES